MSIASGSIKVEDVDQNDEITAYAQTGTASYVGEGTLGDVVPNYADLTNPDNFTFYDFNNSDVGLVTKGANEAAILKFDFKLPGVNLDALPEGARLKLTFPVQVKVGPAEKTEYVTITIQGTNDAPVVSDISVVEKLYEDGGVDDQLGDQGLSQAVAASGNALADASDVDYGDQLSVSAISRTEGNTTSSKAVTLTETPMIMGTYGALTMAANGSYTYTLYGADSDHYGALNALGHNVSAQETFIFTVSDRNEATADAQLSFTVVGSNDRPVIEEVEVAPQFEDKVEVGGQVKASDADGDATAFSFSFGIIETDDPETLGISAALRTAIEKGFTGETDGKWSLNLPSAELDFLSAESSLTIQVLVEANDGQDQANSVGTSTFTITINGQNDAPKVSDITLALPDKVLSPIDAQPQTPLFNLMVEGGPSDPDGDTVNLVTETIDGIERGKIDGNAFIKLSDITGEGAVGDGSIDLQIPIETLIGAGVITVDPDGSFKMSSEVASVLQDLLGSGDSMQLAGTFGVTDGPATTPGNFDVEILGDGGAEDHTGIAEYSDDNVPTFLSPNELSGNDSEAV